MNSPGRDLRRFGASAALVAALLVGSGTFFPRWWTGDQGGAAMSIGLRQVRLCGERGCAARGLENLGDQGRAWALAGATGFGMACVTVVFLLVAAGLALTRARGVWPGRVARMAAGLSLFTMVVGLAFVWLYPGFEGLSLGASPFLFLGGAALGVGSAGVLLGRHPAA